MKCSSEKREGSCRKRLWVRRTHGSSIDLCYLISNAFGNDEITYANDQADWQASSKCLMKMWLVKQARNSFKRLLVGYHVHGTAYINDILISACYAGAYFVDKVGANFSITMKSISTCEIFKKNRITARNSLKTGDVKSLSKQLRSCRSFDRVDS